MLVKDYDYTNPDDRVRDQLVFIINSEKAHEKLINDSRELTLNMANLEFFYICET